MLCRCHRQPTPADRKALEPQTFWRLDRSWSGKLCLLDAADVEYPIAVNLFDMKMDRLASLSLLEREKLTNSALEMYDFIIGSLLNAEMTSRQSTLFRFVTRALFAIPNANHPYLPRSSSKRHQAISTIYRYP